MIQIRRSQDRGRAHHGWLRTQHTFSFANYYDPRFMGFRALRVINQDEVAPGAGFPTHSHRDMEIISYVIDGAIEHNDSMGNGSVIRPSDVQGMSAGTGVSHSEFNHSDSEPLHFLQIWLLPDRRGHEPGYQQRHFAPDTRRDVLKLVASPDGSEGSIRIHQDTKLYSSLLSQGTAMDVKLEPGRHGWLQLIEGEVRLNGEALGAGDGAAVSDMEDLVLESRTDSHFLLFDLA